MEKEGASEGGSNRPDSNASVPDLNEVKAITAARQAVEAEKASFSDSLVAAERQHSEIRQRIDSLDASCQSHLGHDLIEGAFRSSLAKHDHALVSACAAEMEARAALNAFRVRNEIRDPAKYPEDRLFHFSLLILFIAIETGVNAFFYEGSSGLLGGAFIAFAVSVVNMGIAAILGALFRYSNLPELKHKLVGYGALLGFVLTGFVLNLIFSTFRIQHQILQVRIIEEGLPEPTTAMLVGALRTAVVDAFSVFQLNFPAIDFMSFTLFFVGFGCSVIAFWKGYTFDDRHPGHGDMDRRHKAAEKAFADARAVAFEDAHAGVRQMADEVQRLRDSIVSEQRAAAALKAQAQSAHATLCAAVSSIQGELDLVIETYRAANRATRATFAPQYFSEKPSVLPEDDGSKRLSALSSRIEEVAALAKALADTRASTLGDRLQQIRQKINELVEKEFQKQMDDARIRAQNSISSRGQSGG
ncbi:MAG: hypothetical protein FJX72_17275 [Armatimonadetes bacterium]|nr:hypothetical protein [Armatimonadota bacterium]